MKLAGGQICTTTEVLKEFFDMSDRLIHNIPEKERYKKIHGYLFQLTEEGKALSLGELELKGQKCYGFKYQDELYVIPQKFIKNEAGKVQESSDEEGVIPFKKAN